MNTDPKHTPNTAPWLDRQLALARQYYLRGRMKAAMDIFIDLGARHRDDPRPYLEMARALIDDGQFKEARAALKAMPREVRDESWEELAAYCLGALGEAEAAGEMAVRILERDSGSAFALNLQGMLAADRGEAAEAEALFQRAAEADRSFGEPCVHLGTLYWEAGYPEQGLTLLEEGFQRSPEATAAVTRYHTAVTAAEAWERAEPVFETALAACPDSERIRFLHIDILLKRQNLPGAMAAIEKAMAVLGAGDGLLDAALHVRQQLSQDRKDPSGQAPAISLCMIVRNEQAHLARCLDSVKPMVDEMVVVDTGSEDRTADLARAFGARVFETRWQNDFSQARNLSLEKARGGWILVLDADEVISARDHGRLRDLVDGAGQKTAFSMVTRNYMLQMNALGWQPNNGPYQEEAAGNGWFPSEKVRLFPNLAEIRFSFPVHELVEPSLARAGIEVRSCPIPVHHYGKLNLRQSKGKGEAYFQIGLEKVDQMAGDPRALRELAIQATNLERYDDAVTLWTRLAKDDPENAEILVNLSSAHWHGKRYGAATECAQRAVALAPHLKEAHYNLANSLLHLGKADPAEKILQETVANNGDYLAGRFLLAATRCCLGRADRGGQGLRDLTGTALGPGLALSCVTLIQSLTGAGQQALAQCVADGAARAGCDISRAQALMGDPAAEGEDTDTETDAK